MTIREATLADGPTIIELARHFHADTAYRSVITFEQQPLERLLPLVLEQGVILLAEMEPGRAVGMLVLVALEHPYTGERFADELAWWVEPELRSGLVGPKLLRAGEAWAQAKKCAILKMIAPAGSRVGVYYRRLGYQEVETTFVKEL